MIGQTQIADSSRLHPAHVSPQVNPADIAHHHVKRAAMVLSAANDILQLTGASETTRTIVSRRAFDMALHALGQASAVLQSRESTHV